MLLHKHVDILRSGANEGVGELGVGHSEAEGFGFAIEERLLNHLAEDLLLEHSAVDLLAALLHLLAGLLDAVLEILDVDSLAVDLGHGGAGAEESAAGSEEVTDDEGEERQADDDKQKH